MWNTRRFFLSSCLSNLSGVVRKLETFFADQFEIGVRKRHVLWRRKHVGSASTWTNPSGIFGINGRSLTKIVVTRKVELQTMDIYDMAWAMPAALYLRLHELRLVSTDIFLCQWQLGHLGAQLIWLTGRFAHPGLSYLGASPQHDIVSKILRRDDRHHETSSVVSF